MADEKKQEKPVVAIRMTENYRHEFQFNGRDQSAQVRAGDRLEIDRENKHRFPIRRIDNSVTEQLADKLVSDGKAEELRG